MQRVATCMYIQSGQMLLLNKPRRGWWGAPGGKIAEGESISEACEREFYEETGLTSDSLKLVSIFTIIIKKDDQVIKEWMFYTFKTEAATGTQMLENHEGYLEWHSIEDVHLLPMAEGDRIILNHALYGQGVLIGAFVYTEDYQLLETRYSIH